MKQIPVSELEGPLLAEFVAMLRERYDYNIRTGEFIRKVTTSRRAKAGTIATHKTPDGYLGMRIEGGQYKAHRIAWMYMTGEQPPQFIDHINGKRDDNRWDNLRAASKSENAINRLGYSDGAKGVTKRNGRWVARINLHGEDCWIGTFDTENEAIAARYGAAVILHREFASEKCRAVVTSKFGEYVER